MAHDAYICYDNNDRKVCDAVDEVFRENGIKSWIKSRDFSSDDPADITKAIEASKCFILIYSEVSKDDNYVITETDIAFSRNIPIIVFNIDDSSIKGNLEFILENQDKINSFPNSKKQLGALVKKTSEYIGKPVGKPKVNSKSVNVLDIINPKRKENNIKKYITIAIPIAVVLVLIYFFVIIPMGQNTTEDGVFSMNITDVDVSPGSNYKYTVYGQSYNMPADSGNYLMNIRFLDENGYKVFEVNSTADEFKSGIICSYDLKEDNITNVAFKLIDLNNNVLSEQNYVME